MQEPARTSNKEHDKQKHPFRNIPDEHCPRGDTPLETGCLYISMFHYFKANKNWNTETYSQRLTPKEKDIVEAERGNTKEVIVTSSTTFWMWM